MIGAEKSKTIGEMVLCSGRRERRPVGVRKDSRPWSTIRPGAASLFVPHQLLRSNTIRIKLGEAV